MKRAGRVTCPQVCLFPKRRFFDTTLAFQNYELISIINMDDDTVNPNLDSEEEEGEEADAEENVPETGDDESNML
jgi:hypothetical protein